MDKENAPEETIEAAAPEVNSAKQPDVSEDQLKDVVGKYPIELLTEQSLADASVEQCEQLITYMRHINQTLIAKANMVHGVMEAKERAAIDDAKVAGQSEEEIASLEAAIARRKAKASTQNLGGSHITKDEMVGPSSAG